MDETALTTHRDPDLTPAQEKIGRLTQEFRDVLGAHGYPNTEAHAKVADFKAAVLELMWEELRNPRREPPLEYRRWWRGGRRWAWLRGFDLGQDLVFKAMMRQESWARTLRKPNRTVEGG